MNETSKVFCISLLSMLLKSYINSTVLLQYNCIDLHFFLWKHLHTNPRCTTLTGTSTISSYYYFPKWKKINFGEVMVNHRIFYAWSGRILFYSFFYLNSHKLTGLVKVAFLCRYVINYRCYHLSLFFWSQFFNCCASDYDALSFPLHLCGKLQKWWYSWYSNDNMVKIRQN